MTNESTVAQVFTECVTAIKDGKLISRENRQDKEFHFQNWFLARLDDTSIHYEQGGRNSYPDFRIVHIAEGYEGKRISLPRTRSKLRLQQPSSVRQSQRTLHLLYLWTLPGRE